jgi:hypothetical protein
MYVKKEHEGEDFYIQAICTRRFLYIRDLYHRRSTVNIFCVLGTPRRSRKLRKTERFLSCARLHGRPCEAYVAKYLGTPTRLQLLRVYIACSKTPLLTMYTAMYVRTSDPLCTSKDFQITLIC